MTEPHTAPTNLRSLTTRLDNLARQSARPIRRVQRTIANTVVGQMLPSGVMKGGAAMSVRVGEAASRFTTDLDAARHTDLTLDGYLDELARRLDVGWGGFTGTLKQLPPAAPEGVPEQYVMQPFKIRLLYLGRHWLTVPFELGHDEIGNTKQHELRIAHDIVTLFESIGLPEPQPIRLLTVEHQIASHRSSMPVPRSTHEPATTTVRTISSISRSSNTRNQSKSRPSPRSQPSSSKPGTSRPGHQSSSRIRAGRRSTPKQPTASTYSLTSMTLSRGRTTSSPR